MSTVQGGLQRRRSPASPAALRGAALALVLGLVLGLAGCPEKKGTSGGAAAPNAGGGGAAPAPYEPIGADYAQGGPDGKADDPKIRTSASGLKLQDFATGDGPAPTPGQMVSVKYEGKLGNGTMFDSGTIPFELGAGRVIKGWDEGIATMRVHGVRRLIIPADLAYGATGTGGGRIPPNATLYFKVELLGIEAK